MNETEELSIDGAALSYFFSTDSLYRVEKTTTIVPSGTETEQKTDKKPGLPTTSNGYCFVFQTITPPQEDAAWDMVVGLTENPKAMNLSLAQISILNLSLYPELHWEDLIKEIRPSKVILWGHLPATWNLMLQPYEVKTIGNVSVLLCDEASRIKADPPLKAKLWTSIKNQLL